MGLEGIKKTCGSVVSEIKLRVIIMLGKCATIELYSFVTIGFFCLFVCSLTL